MEINLEYVRDKLEKLIYYVHDLVDSALLWCLYKVRPQQNEQSHDQELFMKTIEHEIDQAVAQYLAHMNDETWEHSKAAYMVMVGMDTPDGPKSIPMYFTEEQWEMIQALSRTSNKPVMDVILDIAADRWEMSNEEE